MKTKKLIGALVAIVMSASCAAGLAACNTNSGHTHSWKYKDLGGGVHRQECSCGETKEAGPHTNADGNTTCDDCGADLSAVVAVTSVTLSQTQATLKVGGEKLTLTATVKPAGAATVVWTSSDPSVAKVENGVVTALKEGTATITATAGTKSATCSVTVIATPSKPVEMTADKWAAAFTFGDKVSIAQTYKTGDSEQFGAIKVDGDKSYLHYRDGEYEQEAYREKVGEKSYLYSKGYEYWTKNEDTSDIFGFEESKEILLEIKYYFPFDKFEKGEENGEYVSKEAYSETFTVGEYDPQTISIKEAKIYFNADGKIVSMEHVAIADDREQAISTVFGYNEKLTLPEVLEGEQVTPEECAAALAMTAENYRMGVTTYGLLFLEYLQDGTNKYFNMENMYSADVKEMYAGKKDGKYYNYIGAHGQWMEIPTEYESDEQFAQYNGFMLLGVNLSEYSLDSFTYDENAKTYTYTDEDTTIVAMFKDKKLVWANMTSEYEGSFTIDLVYGDAQVTLPTVSAGEQVTDEEWAAAQAMDYDNVEIYVSFGLGEMTFKKVGSTFYRQTNAMGYTVEEYATAEDGKYYSYEVKDGVWVKTEIEKSKYDSEHPSNAVSGFDKEDFTWDEDSETYVFTDGDDTYRIKFVDKKFNFISMGFQSVYFSYGTAELTVPEEGSAASGGGVIVTPPSKPTEKDITEEDWQNMFAEAEEAKVLSVDKRTEDDTFEYIFNEPEGYVYVSTDYGNTRFVYAVEEGAVVRFDYDEEEEKVTKSATEYSSLAEIKEEVLEEAFTDKRLGSVKELYDNFYGTEGSYYYDLDEGYIAVSSDEGQLGYIVYRDEDGSTTFAFYFKAWDAPYWYDEYVKPRVTKAEWDKAFEMNCDSFTIDVVKENGDNVQYQKDGNNYRVYEYTADTGMREERYYYADGGKYYRYNEQANEDLTGTCWVKTEITEEEFTQATQMPSLGEHDYADFELDETDGFGYYRNGDDTYAIKFEYKKLAQISCDEFDISIDYDDELDLPQDIMTQAEWEAAIAATVNASNVSYNATISADGLNSGYTNYVDATSGIVYRRTIRSDESDDLLYVYEGGTLWLYEFDGDETCTKTASDLTSVQNVHGEIMEEILSPAVLGGQTITENYDNFEYLGFGEYYYSVGEGTGIRILFKNGRIESMYIITESTDGTTYITCDFYDYGTTDGESELPRWYKNYANKDGE